MSDVAGPSTTPVVAGIQQGKKRKRTGKEREERKQAAIAAAQAQEAADTATVEDVAGQEEAVEGPESDESASEVKEEVVEEIKPEVDVELLIKRLPTALKHLHPVFKKAKSGETARLIKKIKTLKSKGSGSEIELADLEAQRQLLAHHSVGPTISGHLLTNLRKHRLFKRNPDLLPKAVVDQLSSTQAQDEAPGSDQTLKKVENRLCSSKVASDEVRKAVAWLVGEEGAKLGGPAKRPLASAVDVPVRGQKGKATKPTGRIMVGDADEDEDEDAGGFSISRNMVVGSDDEDGSDFDDDGGAADDAGWESGSISGDDAAPTPQSKSKIASRAPLADDSDSDEDAIPVAPQSKKSKTKAESSGKSNKALTSSTFLPSLSTGFTRGGSDDSDPDDDTGEGLEDIIGKGRTGERKNRRGQRARQLIWERKYGKNAKHIKKAGEQATEGNIANAYGKRASVVATAAGASTSAGTAGTASTSTSRPPARDAPPHMAAQGRPATSRPPYNSTSGPARPAPAPAAAATAGLHPSWEAARLRKQKEMEGPKATKIVFD